MSETNPCDPIVPDFSAEDAQNLPNSQNVSVKGPDENFLMLGSGRRPSDSFEDENGGTPFACWISAIFQRGETGLNSRILTSAI